MMKLRNIAALAALSGVAALPACSMFGGNSGTTQTSRASYPAAQPQSYAATPNYNAAPTAPELTPDMIRNVQQTLQEDGGYRGRVDGMWGPATQTAVRNYQQQHNLNVTGQLDQETLSAMNLGQNNAQQPTDQRYGSNYNPPPPAKQPPPNQGNPR